MKTAVREIPIPPESRILLSLDKHDYGDAFLTPLPDGSTMDPKILIQHLMASQALWVRFLMVVRDAGASLFGLKTARSLAHQAADPRLKPVDCMDVVESTTDELVLGLNDRHLDFRISMLCQEDIGSHGRAVVLSTIVKRHNWLGRVYFFLIKPFHKAVVRSALRRAARAGWPKAT